MKAGRILLMAGLAWFFSVAANAQSDSQSLGEVRIMDSRGQEEKRTVAPGLNVQQIDARAMTVFRQQDLAQLLYQQLPVFVKSYGSNGLATVSFRGASAAQSQVLWNGVPIQNTALGITDLSGLTVGLFDKVELVYGSSAALWGTGNVGGMLVLSSDRPRASSAQVSAGAGSFGLLQGSAQVSLRNERSWVSVKAFGQRSQNDFSVLRGPGLYEPQPNAGTSNTNLMLQAGKSFARSGISLDAWLQNTDRAIPPATFESASEKQQRLSALRVALHYYYRLSSGAMHTRIASLTDALEYSDPKLEVYSRLKTQSFYFEQSWTKPLGERTDLLLSLPASLSAIPDSAGRTIRKVALTGSLCRKLLKLRLEAAGNFRIESINGRWIALPGSNLLWAPAPRVQLRANVQRTFRNPTLNELYTNPGGNPDLKPEEGWAEDADLRITLVKATRLTITQEAAVYHRFLENWIYWLGGAIWTPHNIAAVRSYGGEAGLRAVAQCGAAGVLQGRISAALNRSQTERSLIPGDGSEGRQIPYTPLFLAQAQCGYSYRRLYVSVNGIYTGYRYLNTDETGLLPAYTTLNAQLQYVLPIGKKLRCELGLQSFNLLNARYEAVAGRPMPGCSFVVNLTIGKGSATD